MSPSYPYGAFTIYESNAMCVQFRFPRSKGRRIRKKWAKCPGNYKPSTKILRSGNTLICHPMMAARIRASVDFQNSASPTQ